MITEGRGRIDWVAAFEYYAGLGALRSFRKVSERFQVSRTAIRKHARRYGWDERIRDIDAETHRKVDARVVKAREVRIAETIELVDLARSEMLERLRAGDADVKLADLPALIKLEALIEGEPTERFSIEDMRTWARQMLDLALAFVPRERRAEFMAAQLELLGGEQPAIEGQATRREPGAS